jgi:hypothetical protein
MCSKILGITKGQLTYWRHHASLHLRTNGGWRWRKYPVWLDAYIQVVLWDFMKDYPTTSLSETRSLFRQIGILISNTYLSRIFTRWGWSWKKPYHRKIAKYKIGNMQKYMQHLVWLALQSDWTKVKFLDESGFCAASLSPISYP